MIRKLMLFVALFILAPFSAEAKDLYVNNSGSPVCSDSTTYANNSPTSPWCTLGRALWGNANRSTLNAAQAATAGDTVYVTAGTYTAPDTGSRFSVVFQPVNAGTGESSRIIIRAVGTVELRSTGTSGGPMIGANGKNYITWDGFYINEANSPYLDGMASGERAMCMFVDANYGVIQNSTFVGLGSGVENANQSAIFFHNSVGSRAYNNVISNIKATGHNVSALYTYGARDCIWEHNNIYDSDAGLFIKASVGGVANSGNVFRHNKLWNIVKTGVRLGGTGNYANTNNYIYQNIFYNSATANIFYSSWGLGTGNVYANNTLYNVMSAYLHNGNYTNSKVKYYNNIVHTCAVSAAETWDYNNDGRYPLDHDFQHNCYYRIPTNFSTREGGSGVSWGTWISMDANWNQDNVSPTSTNGIDPLFVNATGLNFKLQSGSPALRRGVDILDLDGDGSTTNTIPAGAYITGTEIIGRTGGSLLPPTGLTVQ